VTEIAKVFFPLVSVAAPSPSSDGGEPRTLESSGRDARRTGQGGTTPAQASCWLTR
jgi:hypothetical protein